MGTNLTAQRLFDTHREKLKLDWIAGHTGGQRTISSGPDPAVASAANDPCLVGHLNLIHPNCIQVLGRAELAYLGGLDGAARSATIAQLFQRTPALIIVTGNNPVPDDITGQAEQSETPLFRSSLPSHVLISHLHYYLASLLAQTITVHGVFMEVMGIGVLLTGESGVGKSELALELVSRGHRLIADDAPEFSLIAPDILNGTCPEALRDFLEVRGLGVLNIRAMFGDNAIKQNKYLRLIVHLEQMSDDKLRHIDRLKGNTSTCALLGVAVPQVTLPVAPGRNLAVLVETAVGNHVLRLRGYSSAEHFVDKQRRQIEREET